MYSLLFHDYTKYDGILPPIVQTIQGIVCTQKNYFSSYWKECFDSSADIFSLPCLGQYEKDDAVIHMNTRRSFLNPFLVLHPGVFANYPGNELNFFKNIHAAFTTKGWTEEVKGNALEQLLKCALGLRQLHSVCKSLPEVVERVCGAVIYRSETFATQLLPTIRFGCKMVEVQTFPSHWCSPGKKGTSQTSSAFASKKTFASKRIQEERNFIAINAITDRDVGLIYPTEQYNPGCDVVWVLHFEQGEGIGIFMFETKYYAHGSKLNSKAASEKAFLSLNGLLLSGVLEKCKVLFVAFILCITAKDHSLQFDLSEGTKLRKAINALERKSIIVSLHHLCTEEEWIRLLTPPLYYAMPDVSEGTTFAVTKKRIRT